MWLGQRPEFGSSNLAVKAWAPVMVPRLRGSVIARSQGSTRGRLSTAGSVGVGRAGRLPARSGVSGYWFEQALAWVSVILDFFFLERQKPQTSQHLLHLPCLSGVPDPRSLASFLLLEAEVRGWFLRVTTGLAGSRQ